MVEISFKPKENELMTNKTVLFIEFCALMPFLFLQVCNVFCIIMFNWEKIRGKRKLNSRLSLMTIAEFVFLGIYVFFLIGLRKSLEKQTLEFLLCEDLYWFQVPWKTVVYGVGLMILSRALAYFIVWIMKFMRKRRGLGM